MRGMNKFRKDPLTSGIYKFKMSSPPFGRFARAASFGGLEGS